MQWVSRQYTRLAAANISSSLLPQVLRFLQGLRMAPGGFNAPTGTKSYVAFRADKVETLPIAA